MLMRTLLSVFICLNSTAAFGQSFSGEDPPAMCTFTLIADTASRYNHCSAGDLIRPPAEDIPLVCDLTRGLVDAGLQRDSRLCIYRGGLRPVHKLSQPSADNVPSKSVITEEQYIELRRQFDQQQSRFGATIIQ